MNRRNFLKYAVVGAAVLGSALAGYQFDKWRTPVVPQVTTTSITKTEIVRETTTEIVRLASLYGRLFFDYNGNGVQDGEEPPVAGALIQLKDNVERVVAETLTDSSGDYRLGDVRTGSYKLHVGVEHFSDKRLRYMCTSSDGFRAITEGYSVVLDRSQSMAIGLMEGFLTLPFKRGTKNTLFSYFDHDDRKDRVADYLGHTARAYLPHRPGTFDQHKGIDWDLDIGTEIVASAPGIVSDRVENERGANLIEIMHQNGMITSYGHILVATRNVGEEVGRGDVITLSGESGSPGQPHLHFALFVHGDGKEVDPFCDIFGDSEGYWIKANDPQYPS